MKKLLMTKGLPGSGKSTYARELIDKSPAGTIVRINKDDLRAMMHNSRWDGSKTESQIILARNALVQMALNNPRVELVIVDDTNFEPEHEKTLRALAESFQADFGIADFTHVDKKVCIERDLKRPNSVGQKVINKMYQKYLAPTFTPPAYDPTLFDAIIVDIDGTLAHMQGRSPYDYTQVFSDVPDKTVVDLVRSAVADGLDIIVMSGRPEKFTRSKQEFDVRAETEAWLAHHNIPYNYLFMRAAGDQRDDAIVKRELYDAFVPGSYNIKYVLDDRDRVVAMWRSLGLKVLQVAEGDF